ncbi:MAG: uracil-DNA glycosylase family protein [Zhongshania sp.]|uniref:uracil-DNA glycosylase family protein n=1 Tax=Zhongshania sp. TaxID=1971902 RepID=UPI0026040997|nr:uracil-DNA glycosylase family protein [Zhongshania sp.]MDF1692048.1 uracil-DNA glycosylase family protein [Zhongshania sp.]
MESLLTLLTDIRACTACAEQLPLGPRPVVVADTAAKILIIGQAPGTRVHQTGIPWNDPSGDRLRQWLAIDREQFYADSRLAIMPMGFCYPGKGASGDLPPRKECAPLWHGRLLAHMPNVELVLLIGQYAQGYYLRDAFKTLTERVQQHPLHDLYFPLPHPSPRNQLWLKRNPWFDTDVLPRLQTRVRTLLELK